jgi:hypothetical protein
MAKIATKSFGQDAATGLNSRIIVDSITITNDAQVIYSCLEVLGFPTGEGYQVVRSFKCKDIATDVLTGLQITKLQTIAQNKLNLAQSIITYMVDLNATL